jgi:LacI family repressor for deo operon, udp, cdd, tsx, nupC, and nupG
MRFDSYQTVLEEHHIPLDDTLIVAGGGSVNGGIKAVRVLLHLPDPPTAFFCFNDMTAIGVIHALHQSGYDIPADFSVIGFDDLEIAAYYHPPLTTIQQPIYNLGFRSATMLFDLIQGKENIQSETLEPELLVRGSTAHAQD